MSRGSRRSSEPPRPDGGLAPTVEGTLGRRERALWLLVVLSLVADVVLTHHGLAGGATELNPVASALMETIGALPAMTVLKLGALLVGVVAWTIMPTRHRGLVPLGLAVPWTLASLVNAVVVFG
jgi:hypothetical protein